MSRAQVAKALEQAWTLLVLACGTYVMMSLAGALVILDAGVAVTFKSAMQRWILVAVLVCVVDAWSGNLLLMLQRTRTEKAEAEPETVIEGDLL